MGRVLPVPADRVDVARGRRADTAGGRELEVALHAGPRVASRDAISIASSGVAFVGDTAGIRRGDGRYVMPPTPPPDIDLEAWRASADRILAWDPDTLFLTHFGPFRGARLHFQELFERLDSWSDLVRRLLADASHRRRASASSRFVDEAMLELRRVVGEQEAEQYSRAGRLDYSWQGLARYWRNRLG